MTNPEKRFTVTGAHSTYTLVATGDAAGITRFEFHFSGRDRGGRKGELTLALPLATSDEECQLPDLCRKIVDEFLTFVSIELFKPLEGSPSANLDYKDWIDAEDWAVLRETGMDEVATAIFRDWVEDRPDREAAVLSMAYFRQVLLPVLRNEYFRQQSQSAASSKRPGDLGNAFSDTGELLPEQPDGSLAEMTLEGDGGWFRLVICSYDLADAQRRGDDPNRLIVDGHVILDSDEWRFIDTSVKDFDVKALADWLDALAAGKPVSDVCAFTEPNLRFERNGKDMVRIFFNMEAMPPWARPGEVDAYGFDIPVGTGLACAARQLRQMLDQVSMKACQRQGMRSYYH